MEISPLDCWKHNGSSMMMLSITGAGKEETVAIIISFESKHPFASVTTKK